MLKFFKFTNLICIGNFSHLHRKCMYSRRPCRHWSTPSLPLPHTILKSGQLRHPPTVTSVRGSCGALHGKAWSVWSVEWSATKSVRTSSMLTVCRVSTGLSCQKGIWIRLYVMCLQARSLQLLISTYHACLPPMTDTKDTSMSAKSYSWWHIPIVFK
jgi:hypothetical protein